MFYLFASLFDTWLSGRQLDSPATPVPICCNVVLLEVGQECLDSHRYTAGKWSSIPIIFSSNSGYSTLMATPKLNKCWFLKPHRCDAEQETTSVNFHTPLCANPLVYLAL